MRRITDRFGRNATARASLVALVMVLALVVSGCDQYGAAVVAHREGDYDQALRILRPLAESGHTDAQLLIGMMYSEGDGVPPDREKALMWYRRSAEQGNRRAQTLLGVHLKQSGSYEEAVKWLRMAASLGDDSAQFDLGVLHDEGKGIPRIPTVAAWWYRQAADNGNHKAAFNLGSMYSNGNGIAQDSVQGYFWLGVAEKQGDTAALEWREVLSASMEPSEIAEAEKLLEAWKPRRKEPEGRQGSTWRWKLEAFGYVTALLSILVVATVLLPLAGRIVGKVEVSWIRAFFLALFAESVVMAILGLVQRGVGAHQSLLGGVLFVILKILVSGGIYSKVLRITYIRGVWVELFVYLPFFVLAMLGAMALRLYYP